MHPLNSLPQILEALGLENQTLSGKTVLVTGAGRGIGLQAARSFGMLGAKVILAEISPQIGREAERLMLSEGSQAVFIQTDVSSSESIKTLADCLSINYGCPDILVNNAILCPVAQLKDMDENTWDQVIAVNLRGTFLTSKTFFPGMATRGSGTIINMVSTDAMPGLSAYIASKQGIVGFSQSVALEATGAGVYVIPFAPGMVETPAIQAIAGELAPLLGMSEEAFLHLSLHPAYAGLMPPEHAGAATAYLACRLAREFHGQVVNGYDVLERAGFIHAADLPAQGVLILSPSAVQARVQKDILPLIASLKQIIAATGKEFERLPVFVRPISRNGFKSKSGASLEDWNILLTKLEERKGEISLEERPAFCARLEKLAAYYQSVPGETARFTRDQALLQSIVEVCAARIACISELQAAIKQA